VVSPVSRIHTSRLAVAALSIGLAVPGLAVAAQATDGPADGEEGSVRVGADVELVERPAERFEQSIETHRLRVQYRDRLERAEQLDAAPAQTLLEERAAEASELGGGIADLERRIERAERELRRERAEEAARPEPTEAATGLAGGVSQATLDAIAACESAGDPTAVNPAGYYGKYQFDTGTWASVGGSGNPAEASEAEQDYRASLLYSRAGSSPWPVCGA
jgi:soluble lytic murein transglycosylase-like protein